jgi:hypothetical protein
MIDVFYYCYAFQFSRPSTEIKIKQTITILQKTDTDREIYICYRSFSLPITPSSK